MELVARVGRSGVLRSVGLDPRQFCGHNSGFGRADWRCIDGESRQRVVFFWKLVRTDFFDHAGSLSNSAAAQQKLNVNF